MTDSRIDFVRHGPSSPALLQNEAAVARGSRSKRTCKVRWQTEPAVQMSTCHKCLRFAADHLHEQQSRCTVCQAVRADHPSRHQLLAAAGNTLSSTAPCRLRRTQLMVKQSAAISCWPRVRETVKRARNGRKVSGKTQVQQEAVVREHASSSVSRERARE
jgi:hypothetical protein